MEGHAVADGDFPREVFTCVAQRVQSRFCFSTSFLLHVLGSVLAAAMSRYPFSKPFGLVAALVVV